MSTLSIKHVLNDYFDEVLTSKIIKKLSRHTSIKFGNSFNHSVNKLLHSIFILSLVMFLINQ